MKQPTIKPWNEVTGDLGDFMATEQSPYLGYSSQQQSSSLIRYLTDVTQSNKTTPWYEQIKASQRHLCSQVMRVHFICVCVLVSPCTRASFCPPSSFLRIKHLAQNVRLHATATVQFTALCDLQNHTIPWSTIMMSFTEFGEKKWFIIILVTSSLCCEIPQRFIRSWKRI